MSPHVRLRPNPDRAPAPPCAARAPFLAAPLVALLGAGLPSAPAVADIDPLSGIDFVTVGAPGNPAWAGDGTPGDQNVGRGSVPYEYRIGRFEVTTAQWVEFFNAALDRPASDRIPFLQPPGHWGAVGTTPTVPGGRRFAVVPGRGMWAVGNIDWRMAAIYCNWLCNGKGTDRSAFLSGAYDVGTFGGVPGSNHFTDQAAHTPGARYWIPTLDEWIKAAFYDPNRGGPGQGGYWKYASPATPSRSPTPRPGWGGARGRAVQRGPLDGGRPGRDLPVLDPAGGLPGRDQPVGALRLRGGDQRVDGGDPPVLSE